MHHKSIEALLKLAAQYGAQVHLHVTPRDEEDTDGVESGEGPERPAGQSDAEFRRGDAGRLDAEVLAALRQGGVMKKDQIIRVVVGPAFSNAEGARVTRALASLEGQGAVRRMKKGYWQVA